MTSAKHPPTPHPSRTVSILDTLESIKGYTDKLKIYLMAASSWQVRFFDGKSTIKRSTGQTDKREAIKSAISFYEQLMINKYNGIAVIKNTRFDACASSFMQAQAARVTRKDISAESHQNDQYFLSGKVLPEFRELNVAVSPSGKIVYPKLTNVQRHFICYLDCSGRPNVGKLRRIPKS